MTTAYLIRTAAMLVMFAGSMYFYWGSRRTRAALFIVTQERDDLALLLATKTIKPQPCEAKCTAVPFRPRLSRGVPH